MNESKCGAASIDATSGGTEAALTPGLFPSDWLRPGAVVECTPENMAIALRALSKGANWEAVQDAGFRAIRTLATGPWGDPTEALNRIQSIADTALAKANKDAT